jgi:hypothetical protein
LLAPFIRINKENAKRTEEVAARTEEVASQVEVIEAQSASIERVLRIVAQKDPVVHSAFDSVYSYGRR